MLVVTVHFDEHIHGGVQGEALLELERILRGKGIDCVVYKAKMADDLVRRARIQNESI